MPGMERMRAVLIRMENGEPLDPAWTPLIHPPELATANHCLEEQNSCFRWRWLWLLPPAHA